MADPKPTNRTLDWGAMVQKIDKEFNKPEVVYKFSNGTERKSTDRTTNGFYKRP